TLAGATWSQPVDGGVGLGVAVGVPPAPVPGSEGLPVGPAPSETRPVWLSRLKRPTSRAIPPSAKARIVTRMLLGDLLPAPCSPLVVPVGGQVGASPARALCSPSQRAPSSVGSLGLPPSVRSDLSPHWGRRMLIWHSLPLVSRPLGGSRQCSRRSVARRRERDLYQ